MKIIVTESQLKKAVKSLAKKWAEIDGKLVKTYRFPDYDATIDFVNKVAEIAKNQNHHPEMEVGFDKVKLTMFDHEKGGISEKCHKFTKAVDKITKKQLSEGYVDFQVDDDIALEVWEDQDKLELSSIVIPKRLRGQGKGTEIMNMVIDYSNQVNKPLYLTPDLMFGATSINRLKRFYKKLGFQKNDNLGVSHSMVRYPQNEEEIDERSRSFAFTRKKRLFSKPEMMANPNRYKLRDKVLKGIKPSIKIIK